MFPILAHDGTAYNINIDAKPTTTVVNNDLSVFANGVFDYAVVVADHPKQAELERKLTPTGHLVIIGEGRPVVGGWIHKDSTTHDDLTVNIYKRTTGDKITKRVASDKPKACIARYGAVGDALQLTPLIHQLYDLGYEVTLNVSPYTEEIYKYNPYIKNIVTQERNCIPNHDLGEYWDYWRKHYDRYINLSESIEGKLLKVEGRIDFYTPAKWRREVCNVNYHDQHVKLAGLNECKYELPEYYYAKWEEKELRNELKFFKDKFVIAWGLRGSSHHKQYPFYPELVHDWLEDHPDSYVLQLGGPESQNLQVDHARAIPLAGVWPLRQSLLVTKFVNLVIGPETALTNAASCWDTPKIVLLSHSSDNNLTKYWKNVINLKPDTDMAPCYPCHQLHYNIDSCPLVQADINGRQIPPVPVCTTAIKPETIYDSIEQVYNQWKKVNKGA